MYLYAIVIAQKIQCTGRGKLKKFYYICSRDVDSVKMKFKIYKIVHDFPQFDE
jgi:hypothetical protein